MTMLPAEKNFADLRETISRLGPGSSEDTVQRLIELIAEVAYRCDLLEREVEKLSRAKG